MTSYNPLLMIPLKTLVLPKGRLKLRLPSEALRHHITTMMASGQPLVIGLILRGNNRTPRKLANHATLAKVIDFSVDENGALAIIVEGQQRVSLDTHWQDTDHLFWAETSLQPNWEPIMVNDHHYRYLPAKLQQVASAYPQLLSLYDEHQFDDLSWVCQRWLELLPIEADTLPSLIEQDNLLPAMSFLFQYIPKYRQPITLH
ncbi:LON peptidase substrate-binding domain-containing protein [Thaumasiovibrio subtropicus]|uniref:LON peptidase substrate-binding domain-containing protein n=1 Tax=Thaumasiovibrio subtropicus TaxID=1891207 RepID=UPI00131EA68A|nr:LON peptidase substrate-binding domain-containing protein [Thaumasiovibrio subtropicus]